VAGVKQYQVYSECEGDEGHLWAGSHSDEMEKHCRTKNVSTNVRMNFVQMRDAKEEGENWDTETVMKEDGATKTSEDKARLIIGDAVRIRWGILRVCSSFGRE